MSARPESLVIFGGGTLARLALAYFRRDTEYAIVASTVDREHLGTSQLDDLPCIAFEDLPQEYPPAECSLFVAVGYTKVNVKRAEIFTRSRELGYRLPTLLSSRCLSWDGVRVGENCFVFDGVVLEPGVVLGDDVIVWSGSQISHDSSIGDHCFIGPNAVVLGDTSIGSSTFVGGNATIRNGVTVAPDCVIGAGTVIKRDTARGEVYAAEATVPQAHRKSWELQDL